MGDDDASFADMRRLTDPDADPLALDEETVERLLAGDLSPSQAPPAYAQVAALLAAAAAEPTPDELAGRLEVLAELRAATRTRRAGAHTRRAVRPRRRRWAGLAAVALVGALGPGGAAAAATGHLPGPVGDMTRSILSTVGGAEPATPATSGPASTPRASTPGSAGTGQGPAAAGVTGRGPGTTGAAAAANPDLERLCRAYLEGKGAEEGGKLDAAAFEALARAAGGKEKISAYCETVQPKESRPKEHQQPAPPDDPGPGEGPGGPPPSNGGDNSGQGDPQADRP